MKKSLLSIILLISTYCTNAQLTTLWEKSAGNSYSWFTTSSSNTTGCAYNPITNKLLLADRNNLIAIINVTTGNSEGTLLTTGVGTEIFKWNKIRVTSDGIIYGISLQTTSGGTCKIYRWENQLAAPTLCATFTVTERCGDAFGLSGSGNNTILYASGNGITSSSVNIYVLTTTNGLDFNLTNTVNIPITGTNAWAGRSVDPVTTGTTSDLWIRSQNTNTRRINSAGVAQYTSTDGAAANQVATNYSNARYFQTSNGKKYLALMGTSSDATGGRKLRVLNVTNEAAIADVGTVELTSTYSTNTSGIGDVAIKDNGDGTFVLFYVITNNGVMAVQTNNLMPVSIGLFKGEMSNGIAQLNWTTATEINNKGFYVERSSNGLNFSPIAFVSSKANNGNSSNQVDYLFADNKTLGGKNYYRLQQMDNDGKFNYSKTIIVNNIKNDFTALLINNPIKDKIQLNVYSNASKKIQITVHDHAGKLLMAQQALVNNGNNLISLNAASISKGILLINIASLDQSFTPITLKAIHQ